MPGDKPAQQRSRQSHIPRSSIMLTVTYARSLQRALPVGGQDLVALRQARSTGAA